MHAHQRDDRQKMKVSASAHINTASTQNHKNKLSGEKQVQESRQQVRAPTTDSEAGLFGLNLTNFKLV